MKKWLFKINKKAWTMFSSQSALYICHSITFIPALVLKIFFKMEQLCKQRIFLLSLNLCFFLVLKAQHALGVRLIDAAFVKFSERYATLATKGERLKIVVNDFNLKKSDKAQFDVPFKMFGLFKGLRNHPLFLYRLLYQRLP